MKAKYLLMFPLILVASCSSGKSSKGSSVSSIDSLSGMSIPSISIPSVSIPSGSYPSVSIPTSVGGSDISNSSNPSKASSNSSTSKKMENINQDQWDKLLDFDNVTLLIKVRTINKYVEPNTDVTEENKLLHVNNKTFAGINGAYTEVTGQISPKSYKDIYLGELSDYKAINTTTYVDEEFVSDVLNVKFKRTLVINEDYSLNTLTIELLDMMGQQFVNYATEIKLADIGTTVEPDPSLVVPNRPITTEKWDKLFDMDNFTMEAIIYVAKKNESGGIDIDTMNDEIVQTAYFVNGKSYSKSGGSYSENSMSIDELKNMYLGELSSYNPIDTVTYVDNNYEINAGEGIIMKMKRTVHLNNDFSLNKIHFKDARRLQNLQKKLTLKCLN